VTNVLITKTVTASEVKVGDMATYCGETFTVAAKSLDQTSGLMCFTVTGKAPQYVAPEREVEVRRWEKEKPFVVLTRRYLKSGECRKGRHTFTTIGEASRFLSRTTAAVTFTNF
jgi:transcription initiation factor TFIID subunit TAF12